MKATMIETKSTDMVSLFGKVATNTAETTTTMKDRDMAP